MDDGFILGAGFSKAIDGAMPSMAELSAQVRSGLLKLEIELPHPLPLMGDNIELWLTYLSQPQPWLKEFFNLQNQALFLRISEEIGKILNERTRAAVCREPPDWVSRLIQVWHEQHSDVVSLNYDTLVERVALRQSIELDHIYPVPMPDVRRTSVCAAGDAVSFKLFKLHGSVNWFYSGSHSFRGEVLYKGSVSPWGRGGPDGHELASSGAAKDKVPLIIPPTTEKSSWFQHETLRQVWLQASEAVFSAERIHCVGYSLPQTDLGIRFFLQHAVTVAENGGCVRRIPLLLVNRVEDKDVASRFKTLLGGFYEIDDRYADAGAERWARDLVQGKV